jgi:hypothetical protein
MARQLFFVGENEKQNAKCKVQNAKLCVIARALATVAISGGSYE